MQITSQFASAIRIMLVILITLFIPKCYTFYSLGTGLQCNVDTLSYNILGKITLSKCLAECLDSSCLGLNYEESTSQCVIKGLGNGAVFSTGTSRMLTLPVYSHETMNLAAGKSVIAFAAQSGHEASLVTDGRYSGQDIAKSPYAYQAVVQTGRAPYVTIDLGRPYLIGEIEVHISWFEKFFNIELYLTDDFDPDTYNYPLSELTRKHTNAPTVSKLSWPIIPSACKRYVVIRKKFFVATNLAIEEIIVRPPNIMP